MQAIKVLGLVLVAVCLVIAQDAGKGTTYFAESFDPTWTSRWVHSKNENFPGRFTLDEPSELNGEPGVKFLTIPDPAKRYAISAPFSKTFSPKDQTVVIQYEVRLSKGLDCGGAYLKLLRADPAPDLEELSNDTPYSIMFGPDKCGMDTNKVHFIFQHRNPVSGQWEEKHLKKAPAIKNDKISHLYTLIVRPDNSFEILVDRETVVSGNLLEDFTPAVNPPAMIDDPTDIKPSDWVDEEMIADPAAVKPEDWDEDAPAEIVDPDATKPEGWLDNEPALVADPTVHKPEDWDDEEDGEWEAPMVPNPKCDEVGCGKWTPPMIRNPNYKGKWSAPLIKNPAFIGRWAPRQIPNPNFFEDKHPHNLAPFSAVAIEVWTMSGGVMFNNILVTDSEEVARAAAEASFSPRHAKEAELLAAAAPKPASEGLEAKAQELISLVQHTAQTNPLLLAGVSSALVALLTTCCWFVCCRRSAPKASTAASATPAPTTAPAASADAAPAAAAETKKDEPAKEGVKSRKSKPARDD